MRPEIALFVLLHISCFFFRPAVSHCVPRTSPHAVSVNHSSYSSSSSSLTPSASPPPPKSAPKASPPPTSSPPTASPPPTSSPPTSSPPTAPPPRSASTDAGSSLSLLDSAVITICSHTDHPDLCVSSTKLLLPLSGSLDAKALLKLEIQAIRTHLEEAKSAASKLLASAEAGSRLRSIMDTCISQYDDVPDALDNALKAIEARDKGTVGSMLSAVLSDFETCEQGFEEVDMESLMASYDETLIQLISNCLAIASLASLQ